MRVEIYGCQGINFVCFVSNKDNGDVYLPFNTPPSSVAKGEISTKIARASRRDFCQIESSAPHFLGIPY